MKSYACACAFLLLAAATNANAARQELGLSTGRATESHDTDIVRLTYRRALSADVAAAPWWRPQYLQFGASVWRVPELSGTTRRYDANLTPVWRRETGIGYVEAGIGAYLLSHTINNDTNRLPSALQFGSHVGMGLRLGATRRASVGLALQHLSNAGIKRPNGGINFFLLTLGYEL
jgi:hypothetical protein